MLPNLIIAGVNKAGTTSLYDYLQKHPNACGSSVKETCYYLPLRYGKEPKSINQYESYFNCINQKIIFESTPGYFYGGDKLAKVIYQNNPDVKILIIFREPVSRMVSFFKFQQSMLNLPNALSFDDYFEKCKKLTDEELRIQSNNPFFGLEGGCYSNYIEGWIDTFNENLKIVFLEDLKKSPSNFMAEISGWLDIDKDVYENFNFHKTNKTKSFKIKNLQKFALKVNSRMEVYFRKNPSIKRVLKNIYSKLNGQKISKEVSPNLKDEIYKYYDSYNKELRTVLKQKTDITKLPSWLK